jgi:hypothetical protein
MRVLHFEESKNDGAIVWDIPPGATQLFHAQPNIHFRPEQVRIVGRRCATGVVAAERCPLLATRVRVPSVDKAEFVEHPVHDGTIAIAQFLSPSERLTLLVENPSRDTWRGKPVVFGSGSIAEPSSAKDIEPGYSLALTPVPNAATSRRLPVPSGTAGFQLSFPTACRPQRVVMRSNSMLDVEVTELCIANVCMHLNEVPLPVEAYAEGVHLPPFVVTSAHKMSVCLANTGTAHRFVEIDVEVDAVRATDREREESEWARNREKGL